MGPISVGMVKDGGVSFEYKSESLDVGEWRAGVTLTRDEGPSFGLQWKKIF